MEASLKHEISAGNRSTPISAAALDWPLTTFDIDRSVANPLNGGSHSPQRQVIFDILDHFNGFT